MPNCNTKQLEEAREKTQPAKQGKLDEGDQAEPAHTEAEKLDHFFPQK